MKLKDIRDDSHRLSYWVLLLLATISGYMSYRGAMTLAHDVVISVCYAVAVGGVIFLLASLNIRILPALSNHNRQGWAWGAYMLSILIAISVSSYTNLAGIAGSAVMELDAKHHVENVQEIISQTSISVQAAQNIATSLEAEGARYLELAEKERISGTLSGSKGAGVITGVYVQAANIIGAAANALSSKKEEISALVEKANGILSQMRDALDTDEEIEVKTRQISKLNRILQTNFEKLAASNLHQVVKNSLGALDSVVAVSTSKNARLKKTQEAIIERIRADLSQTKERYSGDSSYDIPDYPVWEPRFQTRLLLAYADQLIPFIVAAIAIDVSPFIVVLMLISLRKEMDDDDVNKVMSNREVKFQELEHTLELFKRLNETGGAK